MNTAKKIRLGHILQKSSGKSLIVPIDHGLTMGPLAGLESTHSISRWLVDPNVDAIIAHKGMITRLAERDLLHGRGVILHLNGMTNLAENPDDKEMLTEVRTALNLGVDGISLQVNFTGLNDRQNLRLLGRVADAAMEHGLPLITMLYDKVMSIDSKTRVHRMRQLMRAAIELGTDGLKIPLYEESELGLILQDLHEDALVFIAGGEISEEDKLLRRVSRAIENGAAGVCVGRNVFNQNRPQIFLEKLADVVHGGVQLSATREELVHAN